MAERLQKFLSRAGVASRRRAEELILQGRVQVNNKPVTELGTKVEEGKDLVTLDGKLVEVASERTYAVLYKPPGVVTTLEDPQGRPTVKDYFRAAGVRIFPVGRLDYDAEGALLATNDGELANRLMHPRYQVPRTYLAKVKGTPTVQTLEKLRGGVRLEDGMAKPLFAELFEQAEKNTWLKLVVAEGRPHLIKRLCAAVGHPVVRLFRPSYAGVGVEGLRPGELRNLTRAEVDGLMAVSNGQAVPPEAPLKLPARRHGHGAPGFKPEEESAPELPRPERPAARPSKFQRPPKPASGPKRPSSFASRRGGKSRR